MTNQQIAQELKETIQNYHSGMTTLKVEIDNDLFTFTIKSRKAAQKIMKDLALTGIFQSLIPQYWETEKTYAIQAVLK